MGVLGKDLFDIGRPRTHVKVLFGQSGYWVEDQPETHPYGEVLTELLNYDLEPFEQTLAALDTEKTPRALMDVVGEFSALPYFCLFLSDYQLLWEMKMEDLVVGEAREAFEEYVRTDDPVKLSYVREQVGQIHFIQKRYAWFLDQIFAKAPFEKKKGQRKIPLAQRVYEGGVDAFVSGVSLGQSSEVDAPQVNIQYAVLELDVDHHELVEKLYFDSVLDFVYVELMRGLQRGFVPKRCANCGRWFLQTPGASYNYCGQPAPNGEGGQTCREVGSTKSFRAKVENNDVWKVHQRAYKKYFARTKKGAMSKTDFEVWERKSENIREKALAAYEKAQTEEEKAAIVDQVTRDLNRP